MERKKLDVFDVTKYLPRLTRSESTDKQGNFVQRRRRETGRKEGREINIPREYLCTKREKQREGIETIEIATLLKQIF